MTLSTMSFIVTGRDKITHRVTHVHVVMMPADTQEDVGSIGMNIRYKVKANTVSPIVYWFMTRILKYEVR